MGRKRAVPHEPIYYVRDRVGGALHPVARITRPSRGGVESTVLVQDVDTHKVERVPARDLIRA